MKTNGGKERVNYEDQQIHMYTFYLYSIHNNKYYVTKHTLKYNFKLD